MNFRSLAAMMLFVFCLFPLVCNADKLTFILTDQSGGPLKNVIISIYGKNQRQAPSVSHKKMRIIDQVDKEFIAHVMPIQVGTEIEFPNHDQIRHHVYSFSTAKTFEIPLYEGTPATPVLFDKVGVVTIGCNIHDWMSAYIYVADTPIFSQTDKDGRASIKLPAGKYTLKFWHPDLNKNEAKIIQSIEVKQGMEKVLSVQINTKVRWTFRRSPSSRNMLGRYR